MNLIKKELEEALSLFQAEGMAAGLEAFQALLLKYPLQRHEILRERSIAYSASALFEDALRDREVILREGREEPRDCYFAGEYALQAGLFTEARHMFDRAIAASLRDSSTYYLASSRLLAALTSYQAGNDVACLAYLDLVDDEVEVLWLKGFNRVSKQLVLEALRH